MYLKPMQDYIDEYDRETVQICRQREQVFRRRHENADTANPDEVRWHKLVGKLSEYFDTTAGERWVNKKKIIEERMQRDRARDALLATAEAPKDIRCLICRTDMKLVQKEIYEGHEADQTRERVLFFFECPKGCKSRRAFFDDGEEFRSRRPQCPKCRAEMSSTATRESGGLIMTETCPQCGYSEETRFDTVIKTVPADPDFMKDYRRFCLTDDQGKEYIGKKSEWECDIQLSKKNEEAKAQKKLMEEVAKIQKLTISDVEKLLAATMEKEGYGRLHLGPPEIRRFIIVPFTFQGMKEGGEDFKLLKALERLIITTLTPTNWRLMTGGIYNQLGVLSGRLRGYDKEYELIELAQKTEEKKG